MSKKQILGSKEANIVAMTTEEIRILGDAIDEIDRNLQDANSVEKKILEEKKAELKIQQILNRARQNSAMTRLQANYGNRMSSDEIYQQISRNERDNNNNAKFEKTVSSLSSGISLLINSMVKIATIGYERDIENISAKTDLLMADIDKLGQTAVQAADLQAKAYTSAIDSSLSNLIDGINEGAYAAASNLIDISAQSKIFKLEQERLGLENKNTKNVRTAQNMATLKSLDAQETEAWVGAASEGGKIVGKAFGNTVGSIVDGVGNVAEGAAAANTSIVGFQGKMNVQKFENEKTITEARLKYAQEVEKKWIEAAANVAKAWLKFAQHIEGSLTKSEAAANDIGLNFGFSGKQLDTFKRSMFDIQVTIAKWGKTMEDAQKMQNEYSEHTGRNIQFTTDDFDSSFAFDKLVGQDGLSNQLTAGMELFNHSVSDSNEMFFEMYKSVSKIGLNSRKYFKDLQSNLRLAEKFQFKGGLKSLMEMSKWAQNVRFNMGSLDNILDKVQTGGLEGIIEQSAKLQVLGGNYAMGADPLAMAYEAFNDPASLAKRLNKMLVGEGTFNSKTGEVDFSGFSQMKVRAMAEATGQDYKDLLNQARQMIKGNIVNKELNGKYKWSDEDKALITNKARLVNGEWKVTMDNNVDQSVSTLAPQDLDHLKPTDNEEKLVNYVANIRDMVTILAGAKQENIAKLERDGYEQWMKEEQQRIQNVAKDFNDNYTTYLSQFYKNMSLATEAQQTMLSMFEQGNSNIDTAQQEILTEGENIATTLSKVNTLITNSLTEMQNQIAKAMNEMGDIRGESSIQNDLDYRWKRLNEERQRDEGYFGNFSKGQAIQTARARVYSKMGSQEFSRGNTWKGVWDKTAALAEQTLGRVLQGLVNLFGVDATSFDDVMHDGIVDKNGNAKAINDGYITQNGLTTKIDSNDQVLAAKKDGPIDKMLDTVSSISGTEPLNSQVSPNSMPYNSQVIGKMLNSDSSFNSPDTLSSQVSPRPMPYNSQVMESPHRSQSQKTDNGKLEVAPIQININGSIKVNGVGGSTDITRELTNNPEFVRSIAQIISIEVEKKVQGGRVVDPINRGLVY